MLVKAQLSESADCTPQSPAHYRALQTVRSTSIATRVNKRTDGPNIKEVNQNTSSTSMMLEAPMSGFYGLHSPKICSFSCSSYC